MPDLQQIVMEMKVTALECKMSPEDVFNKILEVIAKPNAMVTQRYEEIDGHKMILNLTCDNLPSAGWCWHLSFSMNDHSIMSPELIKKIKLAFFASEDLFEIPSSWGPAVRQYLQKATL